MLQVSALLCAAAFVGARSEACESRSSCEEVRSNALLQRAPAAVVSCDGNDAACHARMWNSLGENWWLPFIDGWAHRWGLRAFDDTKESKENGQDGKVSVKLQNAVKEFDLPSKWGRWHSKKAAHVNNVLRNKSSCKGKNYTWSLYLPRTWQRRLVHGAKRNASGVFHDWERERFPWKGPRADGKKATSAEVRAMLDGAFDQYERDQGHVSVLDLTHPRKALDHVLQPLARLYAYIAELHPFPDANSRTRAFVLQTSMVRAGGHPLLLPDNGWWIYEINSYEEVFDFFLVGWCAYEYFLQHGVSPFADLATIPLPKGGAAADGRKAFGVGALNNEAVQIGRALYDKRADKCIRSPKRGPIMPSYTDIDANKDGVLTPQEFQKKRALEAAEIEKKVKKVTQLEKHIEDAKLSLERKLDEMPAYEDLDRNKDGVVTPAEYRTSSDTAMAKSLSYKVLDGNADGAVTPENFKRASEKWAAEMKMQVEENIKELATAREERRKLEQETDSMVSYEDLDKQRDGVITRSEYGQHLQATHDTWSVDSPAAATNVPAAATKVPGSQAAGASSAKQAHQVQKAGSMTTGLSFVCLAVLVKAL